MHQNQRYQTFFAVDPDRVSFTFAVNGEQQYHRLFARDAVLFYLTYLPESVQLSMIDTNTGQHRLLIPSADSILPAYSTFYGGDHDHYMFTWSSLNSLYFTLISKADHTLTTYRLPFLISNSLDMQFNISDAHPYYVLSDQNERWVIFLSPDRITMVSGFYDTFTWSPDGNMIYSYIDRLWFDFTTHEWRSPLPFDMYNQQEPIDCEILSVL